MRGGVSVSQTTKTRKYWVSKENLHSKTRDSVAKASIVIVPQEGIRDYPGPVFPVGTDELLAAFRKKLPSGIECEIAIEDEDYREVALYGDIITLPQLIVASVVVPLAVNILSQYIWDLVAKRKDKPDVKATFVVDRSTDSAQTSTTLSYEGPAETFEKAILQAFRDVEPEAPKTEDH